MNVEKQELRERVKTEIASFDRGYLDESDSGIFTSLISLPEYATAEKILAYYSVGNEPDMLKFIDFALADGKVVALPLCYRGGIMYAHRIGGLGEASPKMLGIPAPSEDSVRIAAQELDFIVVPALVFDTRGFRLGYGGGYYDRYLEGVCAYKVGVARERLVYDRLPVEPHDVSVDCIVTEKRMMRFCPYK